jgi:hypothetical protein
MKLENVRENYSYNSGKASDIVRQLGFAGIALVWIFRIDNAGVQAIRSELIMPATLIVITLSLDFLQYVAGTIVWGVYGRKKELEFETQNKDLDKEEFIYSRYLNWPANSLFCLKIITIAWAYSLLLNFFFFRLTTLNLSQ